MDLHFQRLHGFHRPFRARLTQADSASPSERAVGCTELLCFSSSALSGRRKAWLYPACSAQPLFRSGEIQSLFSITDCLWLSQTTEAGTPPKNYRAWLFTSICCGVSEDVITAVQTSRGHRRMSTKTTMVTDSPASRFAGRRVSPAKPISLFRPKTALKCDV